ncbi:hypothetical protein PLICRDRAFT_52285 [Plicaturopsis crispa FD-325 SS-3]|nr:hypothetical protein PLICRDRAFT_52285 [Plicaturopsis crispa FD-325 SS-3]
MSTTSRDIQTKLNYFVSTSDEPPFNYVHTPPPGRPQTNVEADEHTVVVHDLRGKEASASLDRTGFAYVNYPSAEKHFLDEADITNKYYEEVEDIIKKETGARLVYIFDHTIRRGKNLHDGDGGPEQRAPVSRVHVDQTYESAIDRVRHHMGADTDHLLKARVRLINVWRPIENVIAHHPLATADYRSLDPADLVPTRHIYPDREGATFSVKYNPHHLWYYLSDQTPDEVTLIKCFDSATDVARLTPHSAFFDSTSPESAPQRQSIEVRALVFDGE